MNTIIQFLTPVAGLIALIGTYMIILSYEKTHIYDRVRSKGRTVEGIVTEIYQDPGPLFGKADDERGFAPIVVFDSHIGNHRYVSTTYQHPSPYKVGDKVKVWYYFYKSRREIALADDAPGDLPSKLLDWGIVFCLLGYPYVLLRLAHFF